MDDLMETILRNAKAKKYAPNFKKHSIGVDDLKLLSEEDLLLIGIEEEHIRRTFIEHVNKYTIRYAENRLDLKFNEEYSSIVVFSIVKQLVNHISNFMCVLGRKNVIICEVELRPAVRTMKDSINSLEIKLNEFENKIMRNKLRESRFSLSKGNKCKAVLFPLAIGTIVIFSMYRYVK